MALRIEKVVIDGIEFTVKERTFADIIELQKRDKVEIEDIYKQSITPFDKAVTLGAHGGRKLLLAYERVNSPEDECSLYLEDEKQNKSTQ